MLSELVKAVELRFVHTDLSDYCVKCEILSLISELSDWECERAVSNA